MSIHPFIILHFIPYATRLEPWLFKYFLYIQSQVIICCISLLSCSLQCHFTICLTKTHWKRGLMRWPKSKKKKKSTSYTRRLSAVTGWRTRCMPMTYFVIEQFSPGPHCSPSNKYWNRGRDLSLVHLNTWDFRSDALSSFPDAVKVWLKERLLLLPLDLLHPAISHSG